MTIQPIETTYNNHRFRSRLEARYAYMFDLMGIRWQYEPEGLLCEKRLTEGEFGMPTEKFAYLPDFFLPDLGLWAEVKGRFLDEDAFLKFLNAAAFVSNPDMGCVARASKPGNDMLLLGPLSNPFAAPWVFQMCKGFLKILPWEGGPSAHGGLYDIALDNQHAKTWPEVAYMSGPDEHRLSSDWRAMADFLLAGHAPDPRVSPFMIAAAKARFEHGETPVVPSR